MNPLELQLAYPFGDTIPVPGSLEAVAPGLRWVRMPLPFALDHINLWLVEDAQEGRTGWSLVDCGAWISEQLGRVNGSRVGRALLAKRATAPAV